MITFIPWKETEQFHILYTTIDSVSDSSESESENESETVEWIAELTCIDSLDFFNFLDFFRSYAIPRTVNFEPACIFINYSSNGLLILL